jgi:hypothetical protein
MHCFRQFANKLLYETLLKATHSSASAAAFSSSIRFFSAASFTKRFAL